ncbi:phage antirepressor KilAC domain-containing protein [Pseudomonas granadensis]|uniref:phage antirepressor KilAC domain-containing protein n=1 Tax=Pseudomonas granadensis TaxID=1421430 RepID=UPI00300EA265
MALEVLKVKEAKITEDAPKVEFYDDVAVAEGSHTVKQIADMLKTGRNELYRFLRRHKVLIEHGKDHNLPYQVQKTAGRFTVLEEPYKHPHTGKITLGTRTMVTGRGLIFIRELIEEHNRVELDSVE